MVEEENEQLEEVEVEEEATEEETEEESLDEEIQEEDEPEEETEEVAETDEPEELVYTLGEDSPPQEEVDNSAPEWVRDLRKDYKEQQKENRELRAQLEAIKKQEEKPVQLSQKPKLEDYDWDSDQYEKALQDWFEEKRSYDEKQQNIKKQEEEQVEAWNKQLENYQERSKALKVKDFEDSEMVVTSILDQTQQGIIVQGADDPAALVYALGKAPGKAKELASINDPVKFAVAMAKLETTMKIQNKKSAPPPEKRVKGNKNLSGTVDSTLERLRAEAEKTGNYTKVAEYKRNKRKAG